MQEKVSEQAQIEEIRLLVKTSEGYHHHLCIGYSLSMYRLQVKGEPAPCWLRYLKPPLHSCELPLPIPKDHRQIYLRRSQRRDTSFRQPEEFTHTHKWTELVTHQIISCCSMASTAAGARGSRSWVHTLSPHCPRRSSQLAGVWRYKNGIYTERYSYNKLQLT